MLVGPAKKVGQVVIKEIGKRLPKLAAKKAGSRIVGHMTRNSRAWTKAFAHMRTHFKNIPGKPSHAIFVKKFRNEAALKQLIRQAATTPSRKAVTTKLKVGAENIGRPAVIIEREFSQAIGNIGNEACKILRIVVDFTGRPITAYPVNKFLGAAGAVAVVGTSATANAKGPINTVIEVYTAERAEHESRIDEACDADSAIEWIIDFLISPSCTARDPHEVISRGELNQRINKVINDITRKSGTILDAETKANIRTDIIAIWGMGYRMN